MAREIKSVAIASIKVEDRFRAEMGDIKALAAEIDRHGLLQPIGINRKNRLLWGGRRLAAHQHLKLKNIDAVIVPTDDILDELELELVENSARKDLTWQERCRLEADIYEKKRKKDPKWSHKEQAKLKGDDSKGEAKSSIQRRIELAKAIETIPELADSRNEAAAWKAYKKIEEDAIAVAMVKKAAAERAKMSDAYVSAENHFVIGDAFERMAEIKNNAYHFIECDPPYGIALDERKSRNANTQTQVDRYTEVDGSKYPAFVAKLAEETFRLAKPDSFMVFWYGLDWHDVIIKALKKVGWSVTVIPAIWYKGQQGQTASPDTTLGSSYETFFVCRKGQPKLRKAGRSNVFHFAALPTSKKIHPTMKPLDLMDEIYETFTFPGANVLVPFLGSGVSMYAAFRKGMLPHGFELDKLQKTRYMAWIQQMEAGDDAGTAAEKSNSKSSPSVPASNGTKPAAAAKPAKKLSGQAALAAAAR